MSNISRTYEEKLRNCVKKINDGKEMELRELLTKVENLVNREHDCPFYKPILYIACHDYADDVDPSTVKILIENGAHLDHVVDRKEAIHFATKGMNPKILKLIIESANERINATAYDCTALYLLVKMGNKVYETNDGVKVDEKKEKYFEECLKLLLESNIDVNISNSENCTPILLAASRGYKNVVTAILNCGRYVDIDSHRLKGKSAREYIKDNQQLYDVSLDSEFCKPEQNDNDLAVEYIKLNQEDKFLQLKNVNENHDTQEYTLLQRACEKNLVKAVQFLLDKKADVNKITTKIKEVPLEIAAARGYHKIFRLLIKEYKQLPSKTLVLVLSNMKHSDQKKANYRKCLRILWDEVDKINQLKSIVNEYSDTGNTPLHYASVLIEEDIILKLLKQGASLANTNTFNCLAIEDVNTKTLEKHFNTCIRVKDQYMNKKNIIVTFDYTSLIPTERTIKIDDREEKEDPESKSLIHPRKYNRPAREIDVIHAMTKIPEMHNLLVHPLISSFILIKWHRVSLFFWLNLMLFTAFCTSLVTYVFLPNAGNPVEVRVSRSILIVTYILLILKKVCQMILSIRTYFRSKSNILETITLSVCFCVIFPISTDILRKQLPAIAIILLALQIMVILGQYPKLSTSMVMFRTVTQTFFLSLLRYSVLIIAFALSFNILLNNKDNKHNKIIEKNSTYCDNERENKNFFNEFGLTLIKTIVMLTGEFEATTIDFDSVVNGIIFILFVFLISIILVNLLNGLAVSDTQIIQNKSEIMGYIERINYIMYFENLILGDSMFQKLSGWSAISNYLVPQICIVQYYLKEYKMEIYLYGDGEIIITEENNRNEKLNFFGKVSVDRETLCRVKDILHDRQNKFANYSSLSN